MSQREPERHQIAFGQFPHDLDVDVILDEQVFMFAEPNAAKPAPDFLHRSLELTWTGEFSNWYWRTLAQPSGDVRIWPKCEVPIRSGRVCYWGQTGHMPDITKPTLMTRS